MSWFRCKCGSTIHDNTDYQEHKAYFVPDQSWEAMIEDIEARRLDPWDATSAVKRIMYQCFECARLYLYDQSGNLVGFAPESEIKFGILKK